MEQTVNGVVVMGDSICKGVIFTEDKRKHVFLKRPFIKQVTEMLATPVYSYTKFGATLDYGIRAVREKLASLNANTVFIEYGGNDCDFDWDAIAEDPYADHIPNVPPEDFTARLDDWVEELLHMGKQPVLCTPPPLFSEYYFNFVSHWEEARGEKILLWLLNKPNMRKWHEGYANIVRYIAKKHSAPCFDLRAAFDAQPRYEQFMCADGIHPNEKGHALMREALVNYIRIRAPYLLTAEQTLA